MGEDDHWNYDRCREQISSLRGRRGFPDIPHLDFLGLSLDLPSGTLTSEPGEIPVPGFRPAVFCILDTYSRATGSPETFRLVPFRQLPGASAYEAAFHRRAVLPLPALYCRDRDRFCKAVIELGGIPVVYADRAWKLAALPEVPVYVLIWDGSGEFPASAALLFDASVPAYLETEAAAMLGELVTDRIAFFCERRE